jgi:hypothetical protein
MISALLQKEVSGSVLLMLVYNLHLKILVYYFKREIMVNGHLDTYSLMNYQYSKNSENKYIRDGLRNWKCLNWKTDL